MAIATLARPQKKTPLLKALASRRKISVNKLIEELSTQALSEFDAETRLWAMAASGSIEKGLDVLNKLDAHFGV